MNYSPDLKEALLWRTLPPNTESITKISREEGISEKTLRNWRDKARKGGYAAPGTNAVPDEWSTKDARMNANGRIAKEAARLNKKPKDSEKERRKLEKELQHNEKSLAEAAALLVLSKKQMRSGVIQRTND